MINWQQIGSLVIVGGAFFWLVWNKVKKGKKNDGGEFGHCASCSAAEAFKQKNSQIHYQSVKKVH